MRLGRLPDRHHVGRHVARHCGVVGDEGVRADFAKLMHRRQTAHDHVITDFDMSGERRDVRHHHVIADPTIVGDVRVRHEQIIVPDTRDTLVVRRAAIDGDVLTKDVSIADLESRRLTGVFFVLRCIADRGELKYLIIRTESRPAGDDGVRADTTTRPDLDVGADDRVRPDHDVRRELRARLDHGTWVDAHDTPVYLPVSGATINSADATSASSTNATAENFQIPRIVRSSFAVSTS